MTNTSVISGNYGTVGVFLGFRRQRLASIKAPCPATSYDNHSVLIALVSWSDLLEMTRVLSLLVFCVLVCQACLAKPTEVLQNPRSLSPAQDQQTTPVVADNRREQRSPEFGFFNDDYSDSDADIVDERRFKHHKHHHKPGGCNEYPCGGYPGYGPPAGYPPSGGYPQGGSSGSFATASAGSFANGRPSEGQSHANAQSASFNFGPYSASFSVAESSSGGQRF